MQQMIERYFLLAVLTILLVQKGKAQNMNSPYSIYGIGDIDDKPYNRSSGMGGAGLARKSGYFILDNNPAALTGLTRSFFVVDAATTGKWADYSGDPVTIGNNYNRDFWIKRLSFSVKLTDHWASGFGFTQFSNINYNFYGTKSIEGSTDSYLTYYEGDGGLNEYYWINSFSIGKHLSLGLRSSIIAGSINQTETVGDDALNGTLTTKLQDYMGAPRFQAGAIYERQLSKKWGLSLGAKFTPKVKLDAERTLTVGNGTTLLATETYHKPDRFSLPNSYAGGIALTSNNKTTYALDYTQDDWSSLGIKDQGWQMINSQRLAGGVEFSRKASMWNQTVEKRYFQLGAFINQSSLQIRSEPIRSFGFTAGMGGFIGPSLNYSLAVEAGQRGTTRQSLIKENYLQFTISFSYRDFLRSKGRKYD